MGLLLGTVTFTFSRSQCGFTRVRGDVFTMSRSAKNDDGKVSACLAGLLKIGSF